MEMGFTIENSDLGSLIPRSWIFFIFFTRTIVRSTYASQKSLLDPPEDSGLCSSFLHVSSKNSKIIVKKYLKKIVIELFADLETSRNHNHHFMLHASCFMLHAHMPPTYDEPERLLWDSMCNALVSLSLKTTYRSDRPFDDLVTCNVIVSFN